MNLSPLCQKLSKYSRLTATVPVAAIMVSGLLVGCPAPVSLSASAKSLPTQAVAPAPSGAASLLPDDTLSAFGLFGKKELGSLESVDVTGQPFSKAYRLTTLQSPPNQWELQLGTFIQKPVKKGDTILLRFYIRSIKGQAETGEARTHAGFGTGAPEWAKSMGEAVGIPHDWKCIEVPFTARYDTEPNHSLVTFDMGFAPQSFEIGGIELLDYGTSKTVAELPRTRSDYAGQEDSAPWRKAALARIEKLRKGDLTVTVVDAVGKPVPNAKVSVRMKRHAFRFGAAVAADTLTQPGATSDKYREMVRSLYNAAPVENHLKWPFWEGWARADADKSVDWLVENEIARPISGPLVWGGWTNLPDDMKAHQSDKAYLRKRIKDNIKAQIGAYPGKIREWEVINEPFAQNDLWKILGYEAMAEVFAEAHAVAPKAFLTINDYSPLDGAAKTNAHLNAYYQYIADLKAAKAPVDGIGFQCHFGSNIVPPERVISGLDRFATFGLPISITEFDIDSTDEDLQRRYLRDFLTAAFSHPAVDTILMWGFWEGKHWLPNAALYRTDWSIKPSGQAWLDLVHRDWWTNADGKTDAAGSYKTRGFYGVYELTATAPGGKTKTVWLPFEKAEKAGKPLTIRLDSVVAPKPRWIAQQEKSEQQKTARLAAGVPLLQINPAAPYNLLANKALAGSEPVAVTGQFFATATRFTVTKATAQPWEVQALVVTQEEIKKGDHLKMSFWVRATPGEGNGKLTASFQTGGPEYAVFRAETLNTTSDWKRVELTFTAQYDRAAGGAMLVLQMGYLPQSLEVGGLSATNFGSKAH